MKSCTSSQVDFARNKDEWGVGQRMTWKKYVLTSRERRCAVWIVPSTQVRQRSMMAGDTVWKWPNKSILGEGGGRGNPLSLRKKLMMRTHFQTVADRSEGGDIQHLLLTWKLASIWMIFFCLHRASICQVWPYSHDETGVLQVVRVRLVVVLQVHTQSKLVQGDARVHLDYEELNFDLATRKVESCFKTHWPSLNNHSKSSGIKQNLRSTSFPPLKLQLRRRVGERLKLDRANLFIGIVRQTQTQGQTKKVWEENDTNFKQGQFDGKQNFWWSSFISTWMSKGNRLKFMVQATS